jgi:cell division protein FtsB
MTTMDTNMPQQVAAILRFKRFVELLSDPKEGRTYINGEPMAPDATAFLSYFRDIEQGYAEGLDAVARAAAAEAEVARLRDENAEAWHAFDRQQSRGDRLATRVAELEAEVARLRQVAAAGRMKSDDVQ